MGKKVIIVDKPDLPRRLFWEFRYDDIDWRNGYLAIMTRVLERGTKEEWKEMIRFYGEENVVHAIKHEIKFLADYAIEDVCNYFNLTKEELLCYIRKQSRWGHWI